MRRRSLLFPAVCAVAAAAAAAGPAAAAVRFSVPISHAARLQIPGAAGSVIVSDPSVADAVVINAHTIYVQGKGYGETEIVVLDRAGHEVWQGDVTVITAIGSRVTVLRGPVGSSGGAGAANALLGGAVMVSEMTCSDVCTQVVPPPNKDSGKDK